jgi:hypothetical protein
VSDVGGVCDLLTPAARAAVARSGPDRGMGCAESLGKYYAYAERDNPRAFREDLETELLGVRIRGDRAVVSVEFVATGRQRGIPLTRTENGWRMPAVPGNAGTS